jgi:hypothetical protein
MSSHAARTCLLCFTLAVRLVSLAFACRFADLSYEEFKAKILTNLTLPQGANRGRMLLNEPPSEHELAARRKLQGSSIDWRQAGKESPMKSQGG